MNGDTSLQHEITGASFGFYSAEEIRSISVKHIDSAVAFTGVNQNAPVIGGLYDPSLGPVDPHVLCPVCSLDYVHCPGHVGHIELAAPVYNPLLFPVMYKLLRGKCFNCHHFKVKREVVARFQKRLSLIAQGRLQEALDEMDRPSGAKQLDDLFDAEEEEEEEQAGEVFCQPCHPTSQHARAVQRRVTAEFFASFPAATQSCDNCGAYSPKLRKAGYVKIFTEPLSEKLAKQQDALGMPLRGAAIDETGGAEGDADPDNSVLGDVHDDDDTARSQYLPAQEVQEQLRLLWQNENAILSLLFDSKHTDVLDSISGDRAFFVDVLPVPPSRFRPPAMLNGQTIEHPHTAALQQILKINARILGRGLIVNDSLEGDDRKQRELELKLQACLELQQAVNTLIDSGKSTAAGQAPAGYRQMLEKKEGLFRKNMMGKRVNFAARSVISPDPYIKSTEIGVPLRFATHLTYPEPVTAWNVDTLRKAVLNGPEVHPGAVFVEYEDGRKISLANRTRLQRDAISKTLLSSFRGTSSTVSSALAQGGSVKRVWRHLISGDVLLVNRQPTLHKPGIMAHVARVLPPIAGMKPQQTIRMHYANCETFNADFDGDEINLHFPQDELARAEAYEIAANTHQYLVPTTGEPIRGLIQDHVCSAVHLTNRSTFLTKGELQQLLFVALNSAEVHGRKIQQFNIPPPTILKPQPLWTGKQVITALLRHITGVEVGHGFNMDSKSRLKESMFGDYSYNGFGMGEFNVIVRDSELLQGILDKKQIGGAEFGMVHSVFELYGAHAAAELLSAFGRLFTCYIQFAGHSCRIEDLLLTPDADARRTELRDRSVRDGLLAAADFVDIDVADDEDVSPNSRLFKRIHKALTLKIVKGRGSEEPVLQTLDGIMAGAMRGASSEVVKTCLPDGQRLLFPSNYFSLMTNTGAKGSLVNHSQIACGLGQQALEGRRVPLTAAGRSLPCFAPFDPRPRAGGYIADRFFSGIRPAEYYFHCMAGREGLVDTAVKTSRSGYLQRCLVKHLEDLHVGYDLSVRDSEGNMIQTLYGEDGLDPSRGRYLDGDDKTMRFMHANTQAMDYKYGSEDGHEQKESVSRAHALRTGHENAQKASLNSGGKFCVGDIVRARRKKKGVDAKEKWTSHTIEQGWFAAQVLSVDETKKVARYQIRYLEGQRSKAKIPASSIVGGSQLKGGPGKFMSARQPLVTVYEPDPLLSSSLPACGDLFGVTSEMVQDAVDKYVQNNSTAAAGECKEEEFRSLVQQKYLQDMVAPGENVGAICAQSIGEPSTQMTLNTFHLAGHGGANVTLGIPRLREIIMTASQELKTPMMTIPLRTGTTRDTAFKLSHKLGRLPLVAMLNTEEAGGIEVATLLHRSGGGWYQRYTVTLTFLASALLDATFDVDEEELLHAVSVGFLPKLSAAVRKELRMQGASAGISGESEEGKQPARKRASRDNEQELDEEDEQGTLRFGEQEELAGYGDMDDEEERIRAQGAVSDDAMSDDGDLQVERAHGAAPADSPSPRADTKRNMSTQELDVPSSVTNNSFFEHARVLRRTATTKGALQVEVALSLPASERKLLLIPMIEKATDNTIVRASEGINSCYVVEDGANFNLQTEGINFQTIFNEAENLPDVDLLNLSCNGVYQTLCTYGVEAARASIIKQIQDVFGVYGIHVDPRHLGLLADYMTFSGGFRALNRAGIENQSSPLLQMSFETTTTFLTNAATQGQKDALTSPSARLVFGRPIRSGTGMVDILQGLRMN